MLRTPRLTLRPWRETDLAPFAAQNADPQVMAYFERTLTFAETEAAITRYTNCLAQDGFGMLAIERRADHAFIGLAGIQRILYDAPFTPAVEIGWRLTPSAWGQGYATEAARAALQHGFTQHHLPEIIAIAVPSNTRSLAVMERIGMIRDLDADFLHPQMPPGHPYARHCLYRIQAPKQASP